MKGCITEIQRTEAQFDEEEACELSDEQRDSTRLCCALFHTASESLSISQQYRRVRARIFLKDAYSKIGAEVLLLCMLTWSITKLSAFEPKDIIPVLRQWWKSIPTKNGLQSIANKFCKDNMINELVQQTSTYVGSMCFLVSFPRRELKKNPGTANRKRTRLLKPAADGTAQSHIQPARKYVELISWLEIRSNGSRERITVSRTSESEDRWHTRVTNISPIRPASTIRLRSPGCATHGFLPTVSSGIIKFRTA